MFLTKIKPYTTMTNTFTINLTEEECERLESLLISKLEEHEDYLQYGHDKRKTFLNSKLARNATIHKEIFTKLRNA